MCVYIRRYLCIDSHFSDQRLIDNRNYILASPKLLHAHIDIDLPTVESKTFEVLCRFL